MQKALKQWKQVFLLILWAGVEVFTCALQKNIKSTFGVSVNPDILLNDVCIDDYDALAIPGGFEEYGFYEDAFSDQAVELIKEFNGRGKMIATICVAALALGNSGILKGKRATTYHLNNGYRQKQLAEYGAIVVNEPVVRSDNIITSYCPQTGPAVSFMLLEELVGTDKMQETKIAMGF